MIIFYSIIGMIWSIVGATQHGVEGLLEMVIGAVFIIGSSIIARLPKESK